MDQVDTRTLYDMVKEWTTEAWDGPRYCRIAKTLWDCIETSGLVEGPFGMAITLLESCVVDSVDEIDSGRNERDQAVSNLMALLDNDDFARGARIIEVYIRANPVCRISNMDRLLQEDWLRGPQKPRWWKRSFQSYWLAVGIVSFASMVIVFLTLINLGVAVPIDIVLSIVVGIPAYVMSYYLRKVGTRKMWRAVFIMIGAGGIGFWCLALPIGLLLGPVIRLIPLWSRVLLTYVPVILGAYIGDQIGLRRNYRPYI